MFVWNLCHQLPDPPTQDWYNFCLKQIGGNPSQAKIKSFLASRIALLDSLAKFYINPRIEDLQLLGFHQIKKYPELTLSLSHTQNAGAAILGRKTEFTSLGIDIESSLRTPSDLVLKKILSPLDLDLSPIVIWCLKEAIYKSIMNTNLDNNTIIYFSKINIAHGSWTYDPLKMSGRWELEEKDDHVIAISFIPI